MMRRKVKGRKRGAGRGGGGGKFPGVSEKVASTRLDRKTVRTVLASKERR